MLDLFDLLFIEEEISELEETKRISSVRRFKSEGIIDSFDKMKFKISVNNMADLHSFLKAIYRAFLSYMPDLEKTDFSEFLPAGVTFIHYCISNSLDGYAITFQNGTRVDFVFNKYNKKTQNYDFRGYYLKNRVDFKYDFYRCPYSVLAELFFFKLVNEYYLEDSIYSEIIEEYFLKHNNTSSKMSVSTRDYARLQEHYKNDSYLENRDALPNPLVNLLLDGKVLLSSNNFKQHGVLYYQCRDLFSHFNQLLFTSLNVSIVRKREEQERGSIARAFEEKKDINQKVINHLSNSILFSFFKKMEYDNEVDLSKVVLYEEDIKNFIDYLKFPVNEVTFRIKKLGKHRANGLYYPSIKNLIVDLDGINSFAHEFAHFIDFAAVDGHMLSMSTKFASIRRKYEKELKTHIASLPEYDTFKASCHSKSKYNIYYLLQPTEVFASCAEVYFNLIGLKGSVFKDSESLSKGRYYPVGKIEKEIVEYFNDLFGIVLSCAKEIA